MNIEFCQCSKLADNNTIGIFISLVRLTLNQTIAVADFTIFNRILVKNSHTIEQMFESILSDVIQPRSISVENPIQPSRHSSCMSNPENSLNIIKRTQSELLGTAYLYP